MAFALVESWVWDFWVVDDGEDYHLFFLFASKAIGHPDARHHRAAIGHAISSDLQHWTRVEDVLVHSDPPAFDDLAIWTGCVVRDPAGGWLLFYTGATLVDGKNVQSIGVAASDDLRMWHRRGQILEADPRWYEKLTDGMWHDEAFRDPWVFRDGSVWRMLITARANHGPADDRGVIATATSPDLVSWTLHPPITEPGAGFGQLEVTQTFTLDGKDFLLFDCLVGDMASWRSAPGETGGIWTMPTHEGDRPWDPTEARPLTGRELYVGRVVPLRNGGVVFLAFENAGPDGEFVGGIIDPLPIELVDGWPVLPTRPFARA